MVYGFFSLENGSGWRKKIKIKIQDLGGSVGRKKIINKIDNFIGSVGIKKMGQGALKSFGYRCTFTLG